MKSIDLARELASLSAHPADTIEKDVERFLSSVCRHLQFRWGIFAVWQGPECELHTHYPSTVAIPESLGKNLTRWLELLFPLAENGDGLEFFSIEETPLANVPECREEDWTQVVCFPMNVRGLKAAMVFIHSPDSDDWSPMTGHLVGIMNAWLMQRLSREGVNGFSLEPEAEQWPTPDLETLELFRSTSQQLVIVLEATGEIREMNRAALRFEDIASPRVSGMGSNAMMLWELPSVDALEGGRDRLRGWVARAFEKGVARQELVYGHGGGARTFQASIKRIQNRGTRPPLLLLESVEITQLLTTFDDAERQREMLLSIINGSAHFMGLLETDGRVIFVNQVALAFVGVDTDEVRGMLVWDTPGMLQNQATQRRVRKAVMDAATGRTARFDEVVRGEGSELIAVEICIRPLIGTNGDVQYLLAEAHDLSRQKVELSTQVQLERHFQKSQHLEILSHVAAGVAHDFNNLLTGIMGNAGMLRIVLPKEPESQQMLADIETSAMRSAEICRQMLAFAGRGQAVLRSLELSDLVRELRKEIARELGDVSLELQLAPELPCVRLDRGLVEQLLLNLIQNARESFSSDASGNRVVIRTEAKDGFLALEGDVVVLGVEDNGAGMDRATLEQACEPFFTTKFLGRGLGLAAVSGIVRNHSGVLDIQSEVGMGTRIEIAFPVRKMERTELLDWSPVAVRKREGSILVVDDEEVVRSVGARFVASLGFECITAESGEEAIEKVKAHKDELVLSLIDLCMPGLDGFTTSQEVSRVLPHLPIILMSGFCDGEARVEFSDLGMAAFLTKPLSFARFQTCVFDVLNLAR